jgi:hypothetical protein
MKLSGAFHHVFLGFSSNIQIKSKGKAVSQYAFESESLLDLEIF